jgi:hypothetical protein
VEDAKLQASQWQGFVHWQQHEAVLANEYRILFSAVLQQSGSFSVLAIQ